jgi:L-fuconolactonase
MKSCPRNQFRKSEVIDRRSLLKGAVCAAATAAIAPAFSERRTNSIPIIDTHIHLFDPNRPQGVPYKSSPKSPTYTKGAFPDEYQRLAGPLGVVGAIAVEASPWVEDNLWLLETCADRDIMVGAVGNLKPEEAAFPEYLDRYHKNPLFRGIRYGNLWDYDIVAQSKHQEFLEALKLLARADLVLDTANPRVELLEAVMRINDGIPELRIVIDHLPALEPGAEAAPHYSALLKEIHGRPSIYCKLSAVIHDVAGRVSTNLADHKPRLDWLIEIFGEDRVLFGSDWPNSDSTTSIDNVFQIMKEYYASRSHESAEKYFWKNSCSVYKWIPRTADQMKLQRPRP